MYMPCLGLIARTMFISGMMRGDIKQQPRHWRAASRNLRPRAIYGPGRACYAAAMESAQKSEPPPEFRKMNVLMRRIVKVPKAEVNRRAEEAKKQRERKRNHR